MTTIRHFGMLVPATNTTCEVELCRLGPDLQVHTARLGRDGSTPFHPSLDADIAYQSKLLAQARVEVIALIQTSASLFTDDYDARTIKRMSEASGLPSLTSAQAVGQALQTLGASRIAIASPYSPEMLARAKHYYESKFGLTILAMESLGASDAYAIGKMDANMAEAAFKKVDSPKAEALLIPGGNFPTAHRIEAWEKQFGKPVITTNQAMLWAVRRAMKISKPLAGWGRLLAQMPAG